MVSGNPSRLKNQFEVQKYEQIESAKLQVVWDWVRITRKKLENKARGMAPEVFKSAKIPAIKVKMRGMGRSNADYYPEVATRLKMRRFTSLNELSPKNLGRVDPLVFRDAKRH